MTGFRVEQRLAPPPCETSCIASDDTLRVAIEVGLLRRLHAACVLLSAVAAGWLWLRGSGAALLGLWVWSWWPRERGLQMVVRRARLRLVRLNPWRAYWVESPVRVGQVFRDELSPEQFARLSRQLKWWMTARTDGGRRPRARTPRT